MRIASTYSRPHPDLITAGNNLKALRLTFDGTAEGRRSQPKGLLYFFELNLDRLLGAIPQVLHRHGLTDRVPG